MTDPRPPREIPVSSPTALPAPAPTDSRARWRRPPTRPLVLLILTALTVGLTAACGGGDDDSSSPTGEGGDGGGDAQAYIDAAAASLVADPEFPLDQETATCISTAVVDLLGAENLADAGVSPQEFAAAESFDVADDVPEDATARLSEALDGCDAAGAVTSLFAGELGELPPDAVACLDEQVDRQRINEAMADGFLAPSGEALEEEQSGFQDTLQTALLDAVIACPPVVTAVFLAEAPGTVTPETQACVSAVVEANPDRVRSAMSGDEAAAQELGTEIGTTCAATLGG